MPDLRDSMATSLACLLPSRGALIVSVFKVEWVIFVSSIGGHTTLTPYRDKALTSGRRDTTASYRQEVQWLFAEYNKREVHPHADVRTAMTIAN